MKRGILILMCILGSSFCIPLDQFYPFGSTEGDESVAPNDDGSSPDVPISSLFPFFNHQHRQLIVNTNGAISFLGTVSQHTPDPFPLSSNRRIITPFWADVDIRNGGDIWYRESTSESMLNRASDEIRTYFSSQPRFQAAWIFIATWDNVAFYGCSSSVCHMGNTFQAVLITNGLHSFTIFNYNETRWTTGAASGGNATTGLGGTPAQVGFDAGDGVNYYAVNASRTPDIININTKSNIYIPGKFAFRIDTATIEQGGCNTNGYLTIVPQYLSMLGGETISIGGPCLEESDVIKATFNGEDERICQRVNDNRLTCITPMFYTTDDVSVTVTITPPNSQSTSLTGIITPINLANTKPKLFRSSPNSWVKGRSVTITWNAIDFSSHSHVDIDIFALKIINGVLRWQLSTTVLAMVSLTDETASFTLDIQNYVAVIRLSPNSNNVIKEAIWSDVFFVIPSENEEADFSCSNWESDDQQLPNIANTAIQPCPCTLEQALVDTGRFHRDPACNQFRQSDGTGTTNCLYNRGAKHCVRLSAERQDGVGASCCYDDNGEFIDLRSDVGGGMMQRYNYLGNNEDNIPYLSNFFYDVSPYLQCCYGRYYGQSGAVTITFTGNYVSQLTEQCQRFFQRRPPSDCRGYTPPAPEYQGNTFQAVLITNGLHSFTIFNYNETRWTTGTASGGNATTGLGGTPAQVGFDAGDGVNYYAVNASRTPDIININTKTNINIPGKFAFQIDTATIEQGGCNTNGYLTIVPQYLSMLGGETISIGGPCLEESDVIKATFNGEDERICQRINDNRLTCITPMFYTTNDVSVTVTITPSNGQSTSLTGIITPINLANTKPKLFRSSPNSWVKGRSVTITWNAIDFSSHSHVNIDIFALKIINGVLRWQLSTTVLAMVSLTDETASFTLDIQNYVAVIRLSPNSNNVIKEAIWSDVFFVIPSESEEADISCSNWESNDQQLPNIANTAIQPCPCTLEQALVDTGRFHRDPACTQFRQSDGTGTTNCLYNRGAKHCVRLSAERQDGVGASCCYDDNGEFIDLRRDVGGGMMHRYNYLGNNEDNIPYLSNFFYDVSPYLQCCYGRYYGQSGAVTITFTGNYVSQLTEQCQGFFQRRPPSDCRGYTPPAPAFANGDPHMVTLDGLSYTFNGVGEYTLLKDVNNTFVIDVRMEQFKNDLGRKLNASVLTSLVARSKNVSDTVEVTLNQIRTADVLINGHIVDFSDAQWLDFRGLTVQISNVNESGRVSKEILITFEKPSVAVKVIANKHLLNIITVIGSEFLKGALEGLLGDFDGNETNDLKPRNGDPIQYNSSMENIHNQFGETWRIQGHDSLFTYPIGESYSSFQNPHFVPVFHLPTTVSNETREICGDDMNCIFDYHTTGVPEIAETTARMTRTIVETQRASRPFSSCGVPPVISNGIWNTSGLIEGSTAVTICYDGYFLENIVTIQCTKEGKWMIGNLEIKEILCLKEKDQVEEKEEIEAKPWTSTKTWIIVGAASGITALITVAIVVCLIMKFRRIKK